LSEIDAIKKYGYHNYFDDQRFGSFDPRHGFIAEKILMKHYNGALKIYLTHILPEDSKEEKLRKRTLFENWGNWQFCLETAKSRFEKTSFEYLIKEPKGVIPVLQKIPQAEMSIFFSAYQSYLWNEILRRVIKSLSKDSLRACKGIAGDYLFYIRLGDRDYEYLANLHIPTPASNTKMPDDLTGIFYSEVLSDNELKASLFNIRKIRQAFFKGTDRKALITPGDLSFDYSADEIYPGKKKLTLKFFLPRGSYGTTLVKRWFN
jgi:tRNA pseudouridine13 synthase